MIGEVGGIYKRIKETTKNRYSKLEETYKDIKSNIKKTVAGAMIGLAALYGANITNKAKAAEISTYMLHFTPYELYIPSDDRGIWENVWYIGPGVTIKDAEIYDLPESYRDKLNLVDAVDVRREGAFDIAYYPEEDEIRIFPKNGDTYNPGDDFNIVRWLVDIYNPQTYVDEDGKTRLRFQEFPYSIYAKYPGDEDWREVTGEIPLPLPEEETTPVPEPSTFLLIGSGIIIVAYSAKKRKNK